MKRSIIRIDEEKCNGCGDCIPNCPEGAIQLIDGKARLVSDLFCDGLGACLGYCPSGAITVEQREAAPYDERMVMENIIQAGPNTIHAHLSHLKEHGEEGYLKTALDVLREKGIVVPAGRESDSERIHRGLSSKNHKYNSLIPRSGPRGKRATIKRLSLTDRRFPAACGGDLQTAGPAGHPGCPGSAREKLRASAGEPGPAGPATVSELTHWPVQLHLLSPAAPVFRGSDLVLAADCTAYAAGDFHGRFLKGRTLAIACPKLDQGMDVYLDKLTALIDEARINTLTVVIMEVPCCGGLLRLAREAVSRASRKIPVKMVVLSRTGDILKDEWA